jgi:hypothetical protein
MLKKAMIAYVTNSAKAIWSAIAHPLTIVGSKNCNVKDYRIYGGETEVSSIPITIKGKNYFDLNKVPFSNSATQPYNNGLKATKLEASNRGDRIPISLPADKTIYITLDVVASKISGTAKRVTLDFLDSGRSRVFAWNITSSIAHKSYSYTPSKEIRYMQFYFQSDNTQNAVGDTVTMDNIMLRTEGDDSFELYIEPKTVDIVLDEPIGAGEVIQKSIDGLPPLPQFKGTTIYEVQTDTPPSGIEVCYYG